MPNEGNGPGRSDGYRTVAINSVDLSRSDWKKKKIQQKGTRGKRKRRGGHKKNDNRNWKMEKRKRGGSKWEGVNYGSDLA
jgi:hypothetical protein